jgi:hypothetical protein
VKRVWHWLVWGCGAAQLIACGEAPGATTADPAVSGAATGAVAGHAGVSSSGAAQGGSSNTAGGTRSAGGSANEASASGAAAGGAGSVCAAADLDGLSVFSSGRWDPLGYPPYALDGCTLVYVAPADGGGALHLRNLVTGDDSELEPAAATPHRPTVSGDLIAWEIGDTATSQVRVRYQGRTQTLSGDFEHAGEPRATADAVVFTGFLGPNPIDDTDVYLYDAVNDELSLLASGPGQQRFADVSLTHVVVTDFSEDSRGYFDQYDSVADLLVIDRQSGIATPRPRPGKQAFPLLGSDGAFIYLDWGAVHPEPKFSQFGLRAGVLDAPLEADYDVKPDDTIHTDPAYVRPSLHGQHVDFVDTQAGVIGLYRFTLGSSEPPLATPITGSPQLFGPVAADAMTLVSKPLEGQTLALTAVAR